MEKKICDFEIKELDEQGVIEGYLSTFNNVDDGGDVIEPGAFKKTLKESRSFPLLWAHNNDLGSIVGSFTGKEDEYGLKIRGQFFTDVEPGRQAYSIVKRLFTDGVKVGLSIGYRTIKSVMDKVEDRFVRRIKELKLFEGSITLNPMNELAVVEAVKDAEGKPYPNEHACRLRDPGKYARFVRMKRTHDGKDYYVIIGYSEDGKAEDQAYRYPKDTWSEEEARKHCREHDGLSFEAAREKSICEVCRAAFTLDEPEESTQSRAEKEPEIHSVLEDILKQLKYITKN